jgi:hypothetical protein
MEVWCIVSIAVYICIALMIIRFIFWRRNANSPQQYGMVVDVNESIDVTYPFFNRIYHYSRNQKGVSISSVNDKARNLKIQIQCVDIPTTTIEEEEIL